MKFAFRRVYKLWTTQKFKFKVLSILKNVCLCLGEPGMASETIIYHQQGPGTVIWLSVLKVSQLCQWCVVVWEARHKAEITVNVQEL